MVRRMRLFPVLFLSVFLFACAANISEETRENMDTSISFKEVAQNPNPYEGKTVLWGGEIIQTLPQDDGTNLVEVLEWPLGWTEKPRRVVSFRGRFLVLLKGPIDVSLYRRGVRITVAGEINGSIQGEKIKSVSDPTYRYPILLSKEIHLWNDYAYESSTPYGPQGYDPSKYLHPGTDILHY